MEVFALYGPSGTGKSTSALTYAYEQNIPAIVDDGLLIFKGKRAGGTSAKFEKNYIKAVKRAAFYDESHAREVRRAIRLLAIDKILLIGTSIRMVDRIAERLKLAPVDHYTSIEEVRSSAEIKWALFVRKTKGNHIMPIPHVQVEPSLLQKWIRQGIKIFSPKKELIGETTIVRPNFHRNTLYISEQVYKTIAEYACRSFPEVVACNRIETAFDGLPSLYAALTVKYPLKVNLFNTLESIQKKIKQDFIQYLELDLLSVHLSVTKLVNA